MTISWACTVASPAVAVAAPAVAVAAPAVAVVNLCFEIFQSIYQLVYSQIPRLAKVVDYGGPHLSKCVFVESCHIL